jgi:hypothetical protein
MRPGPDHHVDTREEFVALLRMLRADLRERPSTWENADLDSFLDALAAWVEDSDGFYTNIGRPLREQPNWRMCADMFLAAAIQE